MHSPDPIHLLFLKLCQQKRILSSMLLWMMRCLHYYKNKLRWARRGDRGFKEEACNAVASAMTESSNGTYVMTSSCVKNRYKHLKQLYYAMKEMRTASGFGYDPVSKRVANEAPWNTWLEGHPAARPLKTKSIEYEKMGLVCGTNMAT